jgi:hypothetical protein
MECDIEELYAVAAAVPRAEPKRFVSRALRSPDQNEEVSGLEFLGAGAYLFAVPTYNYAMPSVFKAWPDHVMVVGRPIGLGVPPAAHRPPAARRRPRSSSPRCAARRPGPGWPRNLNVSVASIHRHLRAAGLAWL